MSAKTLYKMAIDFVDFDPVAHAEPLRILTQDEKDRHRGEVNAGTITGGVLGLLGGRIASNLLYETGHRGVAAAVPIGGLLGAGLGNWYARKTDHDDSSEMESIANSPGFKILPDPTPLDMAQAIEGFRSGLAPEDIPWANAWFHMKDRSPSKEAQSLSGLHKKACEMVDFDPNRDRGRGSLIGA